MSKEKKHINICDLPLFIYVYYTVDGIEKYAHIQTHLFGRQDIQDAMIGDFSENWYIRPRAFLKKDYKAPTLESYKRSCSGCIVKNIKGSKVLYYAIHHDTPNGVYIEKI